MTAADMLSAFEAARAGINFHRWSAQERDTHTKLLQAKLLEQNRAEWAAANPRPVGWEPMPLDAEIANAHEI